MAAPRVMASACVLVSLACTRARADSPDGLAFFESKIRPVLVDRCYSCHSEKAPKLRGGLRLDTREGTRTGSSEGPGVVPGDLAKSQLIRAIRYTDDDLKMPPEAKDRLTPEQVKDFETWVQMGAPDPRSGPATVAPKPDAQAARSKWPFSPLHAPPVPTPKTPGWAANDIDAFVLARLEDKGLVPVGDADKATFIRRATFDLTGLPPTPAEVDAFVRDRRPQAYAALIDRLLASPAYGERWGRHWLDVVRYADTAGDNSDFPIPQLYKYRNWVITALNQDKPYDQFIREQIAGDLLPARDLPDRFAKIIATGYIANARRFGSRVADYPQHLTIEDTIDNLGRAFLGLTVNCARCHDHKFDPISTNDYYALYGILHSTRYPWPGIELQKYQRDLVPLAEGARAEALLRDRTARIVPLDAQLEELHKKKTEADAALAAAAAQTGHDANPEVAAVRALKKQIEALRKQKEQIFRSPLPFETAYAVAEAAQVEDVKTQIKGDPTRTGSDVRRGFLQVLGGQTLPAGVAGSGRLQLADWLSSAQNPLTARVMMYRLWMHHFGKGIVATPNDFGRQGKPPTHPELLDHLATRFIASGWSLKAMHRLVMLSRTYRMSSSDAGPDPAQAQRRASVDPTNDLLWKFNRRRLDAESIRDAMLFVSGGLDRSMGTAHPFPPPDKWDFTQHAPFRGSYETARRTVYMMTQRTTRDQYMAVFDGADPNASTPQRTVSTTPLQALFLMNSPLVYKQAEQFAARLAREAPQEKARVRRAYLLAFGRASTADEEMAALHHLDEVEASLGAGGTPAERRRAAWESLSRTFFRVSEFVYVQ